MSDHHRQVLTYRYERMRAVSVGIIEDANTTFLVLIAVQWFAAGAFAKGCVASGSGLGFLLSPLVVAAVEKSRIPAARAASYIALGASALLVLAAAVPWLVFFIVASLAAVAAINAISPLMTQIYQDNYPETMRGRFFSRSLMIRISSGAIFSLIAGRLLSADIGRFRWLLLVFATALLFASWCLRRTPSQPLHISGGAHPLHAFSHVRDDRMFRMTLVSWMFMGFANLMMIPLRIEYLASPKYHLALSPARVALLTSAVPNMARLAITPFWGWLFDRANFFIVRMALNMGFAIGIASFFTSNTMTGMILAAITYGISVAGGDVAWTLWVTKIAPPARTADYMSVHTFLTGVRGLAAPLVGFALVAHWSMRSMGWFSAVLILIGTSFLLPEVGYGGLIRHVTPPVAVPPDGGEG